MTSQGRNTHGWREEKDARDIYRPSDTGHCCVQNEIQMENEGISKCSLRDRYNSYSSLHTKGQTPLFVGKHQLSQGSFFFFYSHRKNDHTRHPLWKSCSTFLVSSQLPTQDSHFYNIASATAQKGSTVDSTPEHLLNSYEIVKQSPSCFTKTTWANIAPIP